MGKSGRDKRKKAAAKRGEVTFGKGAAKTEAKTSKNEEKRKKRDMFKSGKGDDDVESALAEILKAESDLRTVTCAAAPRSCAPHPTG